ncbi:DNA polymerase family B [uncultured virus]|nr:DNA polymerase family B [uncultured virus]
MSAPITVQAIDWECEYHEDYCDHDHQQIRIWCLDQQSKPVLLRIENFPSYFYLALPEETLTGRHISWNAKAAADIVNRLKFSLGPKKTMMLNFHPQHLGMMDRLYYYYGDNNKKPMLLMFFKNGEAMRHAANLCRKGIEIEDLGKIKGEVLEAEISPILKLLAKRDLSHACWLTAEGRKVDNATRISVLEQEYIIDWQTMKRVPQEICGSWITYPMTVSFDIECYSHRHKMFPDEWNARHVVYMISCTFFRIGKPDRTRFGILMGDCNDVPPEKFENTTIIRVKTELQLVTEFARLVSEYDPEIITGYNILGFDFKYLDARITRRGYKWPCFGRLIGRESFVKADEWSSGAYGQKSNHMLFSPGRMKIDLHEEMRRNFRWDSYSLANAASIILKKYPHKRKHDISAEEMFIAYELMKEAMNVQDPLDEKRMTAFSKMTDVMVYCIQDSELVIDIIEETNFWIGIVEMSNIVRVTIPDILLRGQQARCLAQLHAAAYLSGVVLDTRPDPEDIPFVGGFVQDPIPGIYDNILVFDFQSLYPSIIQAMNYCYTTLVHPSVHDKVPSEICEEIPIECDQEYDPDEDPDDENRIKSNGKKGVRTFKFIKASHKKGIVPGILERLCGERRAVRNLQKNVKGIDWVVLEKRQLALKVTANSFFGFLGVRKNPRRACLEIATCITAKGRELICKVSQYLADKYGAINIYSDTDSAFSQIDVGGDSSKCNALGHSLSKEVSKLFPPPLVLEFEKACRIEIFKKKKYAYFLIQDDGSFVCDDTGLPKIEIKGLMSARRDNCKWAKTIYNTCLRMSMSWIPYVECLNYVLDRAEELMNKDIEIKDLVVTRTLGSNYKSPSYFMKVFGDEMRNIGKNIQSGDRCAYVIVKKEGETLLGKRMVLTEMYLESLNTPSPYVLDYNYYLENVLMQSLDQVLEIGYLSDYPKVEHIKYRRNNRCHFLTLKTPVKLISSMMAHNPEQLQALRDGINEAFEDPIID